jgi:hypothetical protein
MPQCLQLHRLDVRNTPSHAFSLESSLSLVWQIASLAFINSRIYLDTDCETMSNAEIITKVPLGLIGSSLEIPETFVDLSREPKDGISFIGSAFHPQGLGWIQSIVRPLETVDSHGQDPSRGARSYRITLPSAKVSLPESPSFERKNKIGWCCDLKTTAINCMVSDAKSGNGTSSSKVSRTQKCQVLRTLVLDPGIAGCLEDETSTLSPPASVRTCK